MISHGGRYEENRSHQVRRPGRLPGVPGNRRVRPARRAEAFHLRRSPPVPDEADRVPRLLAPLLRRRLLQPGSQPADHDRRRRPHRQSEAHGRHKGCKTWRRGLIFRFELLDYCCIFLEAQKNN